MNDTITTLAERFPSTFFVYEARRRPLRIGIYHDILAVAGNFDREELKETIRYYCGNAQYLRACVEGAAWIDLDGNEAGCVTAEQAANAAKSLAGQRKRKLAAKRAAKLGAEWSTAWARRREHAAAPRPPELAPALDLRPKLAHAEFPHIEPAKVTPPGAPGRLGFAGLCKAAQARRAAREGAQTS